MADLTREVTARLDAWIADAKEFLAHPEAHDSTELMRLLATVDELIAAMQVNKRRA